jgi:hypothetical protein
LKRDNSDRVRVARVRIDGDQPREIRGCWITVLPTQLAVGIWLTPDEEKPLATIRLADALIDWVEMEIDAPMG